MTTSEAVDPDTLLRRAVAIRGLLAELEPQDHQVRSQLLLARDRNRAAAAAAWRARGWRPITDDR